MITVAIPIVTASVAILYLGYWVFTDARRYNLNPYKWSSVSVVFPPVGLFLYLQHRAKTSDEFEDNDLFGFTKHQ
jgi:hypothetical protein